MLDVGCGAGDVSLLAASFVGATGSVIGIDQLAALIALARERIASTRLTNVTFETGDVLSSNPNTLPTNRRGWWIRCRGKPRFNQEKCWDKWLKKSRKFCPIWRFWPFGDNAAMAKRQGLMRFFLGGKNLGMPKGGLEPPRLASYAPQTYVSTNSTTSA